MTIFKQQLLWILLLTASHTFAADNVMWTCNATDNGPQTWTASTPYERVSRMKAIDACKKQSLNPAHCAKSSCQVILTGTSKRPLWRCTALDQTATPWKSTLYSTVHEAALAAKAECETHSKKPLTCYVNLIGCKNISTGT